MRPNQAVPKVDPAASSAIYALRFPLAVFVVVIHAKIDEGFWPPLADGARLPPAFDFCMNFFSSFFFVQCAVPLFFAFSAYLLCSRPPDGAAGYRKMLAKKVRAIAVPYFLWIFAFTALYAAADLLGFTRKSFFGRPAPEYFGWFFGFPKLGDYFHPAVGQFWYLRDLMLAFILSPLIRAAVKKFPAAYFTAAVLYRLSSLPLAYEWGSAFLYFGIGAAAAARGFSVSRLNLRTRDLAAGYAVILALRAADFFYRRLNGLAEETMLLSENIFTLLGFSDIAVGSLLLLKIGVRLSENGRIFPALKKLSAYSFWIFAVHMPWILTFVRRILPKIFRFEGAGFFAIYFSAAVLTVLLSLASGILARKLCPRLFALFCGGRSPKD